MRKQNWWEVDERDGYMGVRVQHTPGWSKGTSLAESFGQRLEECESKPWKEIQEGVGNNPEVGTYLRV